METYPYLLKVSIGLIGFYALYWFILRWHTYFKFNRFFLLTALIFSFLAPLIELPAEPVEEVYAVQNFSLEGLAVVAEAPQGYSTQEILWAIYWLGVVVMLGRFLYRLFKLSQYIKKSERFESENFTIALSDNHSLPTFSFLKWLVVNPKDYELYFDTVLKHEMVHIRQWHSLDLLIVEAAQCLLWFNPILIFFKSSFKEIHEYLADDHSTATDRSEYAQRLFGYVFDVQPLPLVNQFFDSSTLKNRIKMLCQKRSSRWVLGRYLLALPLLGLLVTLVAARVATTSSEVNADKILVQGRVMSADGVGMVAVNVVVKNESTGTNTNVDGRYRILVEKGKTLVFSFVGFGSEERIVNKEKINVLMEEETLTIGENASIGSFPPPPPPPTKIGDEVLNVVERQPEFEGGTKALLAFVQKNLKYPAAAARANVEGRVFIQFVVDKTGLVKDSKILKGLGFGCNEEALRIMKLMPKWKPGKQSGKTVAVRYNLPIQFQLKERTKVTRESTGYAISQDKFNVEGYQENVTRIRATVNENRLVNPLYFVDGQETTSVVKLEPDDILSISILKGENAVKKYGERAKNGAVEITMKKKEIGLIKRETNMSLPK